MGKLCHFLFFFYFCAEVKMDLHLFIFSRCLKVSKHEIIYSAREKLKESLREKDTFLQSHYREVPRWEIFMEQELRFWLDLGRLGLVKKKRIWANYE